MSERLAELRLADFERTQLHKLRLESQAALIFTDPRKYLRSAASQVEQFIRGLLHHKQTRFEAREIIWHDDNSWYIKLWLGLQAWIYWVARFSKVLVRGLVGHPQTAFLSIINTWFSWFTFFFLGGILLFSSIFASILRSMSSKWQDLLNQLATSLNVTLSSLDDMELVIVHAKREFNAPSEEELVYRQAISEYLLAVSALVYTRNAVLFEAAEERYKSFAAIEGEKLPTRPFLSTNHVQRSAIEEILNSSEQLVRQNAARLGLESVTISELDSGYGGPSATMFWGVRKTDRFLIVGIKGTSPLDIDEWLIDTSLQKVRVDNKTFPFAQTRECYAHQGFYSCLFPDRSDERRKWLLQDLSQIFPARAILLALQCKAAAMRSEPSESKIPIYITGHSLGGAIAALLYAWLATTELGPDIELRDGYVFGTPMSTDSNFVTAFREEESREGVSRTLWRVINDNDIVSALPPNVNEQGPQKGVGQIPIIGRNLDGTMLDYNSIGYGVRYTAPFHQLPAGLANIRATCPLPVEVPTTPVWISWWTTSRLSPVRRFVQHSLRDYRPHMRLARREILEKQSRTM